MNNIQHKIKNEALKVKNTFKNEVNKVAEVNKVPNEKLNLNESINEAQLKKTNILLDMGILLYEKLRKNEIKDSDFNEFIFDIIEIDKTIYENNKNEYKDFICNCGNNVNTNDKFCAECGMKIESKNLETIICQICDNEIEIDCNYCICCGTKVEKLYI